MFRNIILKLLALFFVFVSIWIGYYVWAFFGNFIFGRYQREEVEIFALFGAVISGISSTLVFYVIELLMSMDKNLKEINKTLKCNNENLFEKTINILDKKQNS